MLTCSVATDVQEKPFLLCICGEYCELIQDPQERQLQLLEEPT